MTDKPKMRIQSITMDGSRVTDIEVVPVDAITGTQRCEPPEHLRGVDGWHWVQWPEGPPQLLRWRYVPKMEAHGWTLNTHSTTADGATSAGWRYLAPVTPPCTVAALVEALERIAGGDHPEGTSLSVNNNYRELESRLRAIARAALALYRGDVA